jgi:hypothetical protein
MTTGARRRTIENAMKRMIAKALLEVVVLTPLNLDQLVADSQNQCLYLVLSFVADQINP